MTMKGVISITQSSNIAETSLSDCLVSYPGHLLEESYPSAEKQAVYSTAPVDWATRFMPLGLVRTRTFRLSAWVT